MRFSEANSPEPRAAGKAARRLLIKKTRRPLAVPKIRAILPFA
jgi:hypothetical protein